MAFIDGLDAALWASDFIDGPRSVLRDSSKGPGTERDLGPEEASRGE
jgi:hypothetical protein